LRYRKGETVKNVLIKVDFERLKKLEKIIDEGGFFVDMGEGLFSVRQEKLY
jgi:hypothetical protein